MLQYLEDDTIKYSRYGSGIAAYGGKHSINDYSCSALEQEMYYACLSLLFTTLCPFVWRQYVVTISENDNASMANRRCLVTVDQWPVTATSSAWGMSSIFFQNGTYVTSLRLGLNDCSTFSSTGPRLYYTTSIAVACMEALAIMST